MTLIMPWVYLDASAAWVFTLFPGEELVKFRLFHQRLYSNKWRII